jgi:hypothetical protein
VLLVFFIGIKENKDIINISYVKYIKKRVKDFINLCLKGNKGIKKAKRYNKCFKKAIAIKVSNRLSYRAYYTPYLRVLPKVRIVSYILT